MSLHRNLPYALTLGFALAVPGCSSDATPSDCTDPNTAGCVVASTEERITSPNVPAADQTAVVNGNTGFALGLYQQVRAQKGNLFYSPFSISECLAMTWAGAKGTTASQMAGALQFPFAQDKVHPAFDALDLALASRGQGAQGQDGHPFQLSIANALWGQMGFPFQAPFLTTLAKNYGAGMHVADFVKQTGQAIDVINKWVSDRTSGKIPTIVDSGSVTSDTRLVLTNAIYYNAAWKYAFEASATKKATFTRADGSTVQAETMAMSQTLAYGTGSGWSAVELPYDGDQLSMVLVLPAAGTLSTFEASFTSATLKTILGSLSGLEVDLTLPRFTFSSSFDLKPALGKMGMPLAFTDGADFSAISTKTDLHIAAVVHKAFVDVDESGTEAAAATAVSVATDAAISSAQIHFDHPFLFVIRDKPTGTVLFVGRVVDPTAS